VFDRLGPGGRAATAAGAGASGSVFDRLGAANEQDKPSVFVRMNPAQASAQGSAFSRLQVCIPHPFTCIVLFIVCQASYSKHLIDLVDMVLDDFRRVLTRLASLCFPWQPAEAKGGMRAYAE
jgi:hypothetical protein